MAVRLNIIVAVCENQGIGKGGELPWRLREEMKHFTRMTKGTKCPEKQNMVLMGRKTWESIPTKFRPLPNRLNVVLSSQANNPGNQFAGSVVVGSFESAVAEAKQHKDVETVWVIGGDSVYKVALESSHLHRIYLTRILREYECDTFFPQFDLSQFKMVQDPLVPSDVQEEAGVQYKYEVYQKTGTEDN